MRLLEKERAQQGITGNKGKIRAAAALFAAAAALVLCVARVPACNAGFFHWSKTVCSLLSALTAFAPFSVAEWGLYVLLVWLASRIVRLICAFRRGEGRTLALRYISCLVLWVGALGFAFALLFGAGYQGQTLGERLGLSVKARPASELATAAERLLTEANRLSAQIPRDGEGAVNGGGFAAMADSTPDACRALAAQYPVFSAPFYARPKWVAAGKWMSMTGISGIFIPFTAEANVNPEVPDTHLPFTMCHEAAHRMGATREDEANFTAFLACVLSPNELYNYSGYLLGYVYAFNALYAADREAALALRERQNEQVTGDLRRYSAYLARYTGPVMTVGTTVNNLYLKSMGQSDGVRSYGRMVDLLCAWCIDETGESRALLNQEL